MKQLKVNLWGKEIGRLVWNADTRHTYFVYNPELKDGIPDIAPLIYPIRNRKLLLPVYGDERPLYQGLPTFIADSLPDSWGNTLFDKWVKENKIPRSKVTPLYKLMFIGTRGMGALEYEPSATDLAYTRPIDIKSLYDLSCKILEERNDTILNANDGLTLQALLAVGTSAGGRQMKAIVAINNETGEIRSGQADGLEGFDYYILKFGDRSMPIAEIETAYYKMAVSAGIDMQECRLLPVEGVNHFLTKRFDRRNGKKVHIQTLAAMNPEANSYEDLVATCRELSISETKVEQLFARMVFNVMANNTDDHSKNFSFLLEENGKWDLAPAYDVTFIFNTIGNGPNIERRMSVGGKTSEITKEDLQAFARQNGIKNSNAIIKRIAMAIKEFDRYAEETKIPQPWRGIIRKNLDDTLVAYSYLDSKKDPRVSFRDRFGREIAKFTVSINSKGFYEVSAIIDGRRRRRYIKPNMNLFSDLSKKDIFNMTAYEQSEIIETLFPVE